MRETFARGASLCLDFLFAPLQWAALVVVRLLLILVGFLVVALAVPFAVPGVSVSDGRPIVNLPSWAWLFGNDFDGLDGDKRYWWEINCDDLVLFGLLPFLRRLGFSVPLLSVSSWLARWWWAAVRNPVNNMRLLPGVSCPVSECEISAIGADLVEDSPGKGGFQFVTARHLGGRSRWYGLYWVHEWSASSAFVVRLGFKIRPDHAGTAEPAKGLTFKLNPCKSI